MISQHKINKLIQQQRHMTEFRDADKIIAYLANDGGEELSEKLKKKLDQYKLIQSLRMRSKKRSHIVGKLKLFYDVNTKEANTLITDTEYVFGKVLKIDRDYEKHFMLEISRQAINMAMRSGDSDKIARALKTHNEILGPEDDSDLPDFSAFEPHQYTIQLPKGLPEQILSLLSTGAIDLSKVIPSKMLKVAEAAEDAKEESGEDV